MDEYLLPFEKRKSESSLIKKDDSLEIKDAAEESVKELLLRGILVLDKPSGPTSHQAVDYLKKILKISKAGHSGTLDPGVTGVLPVALGRATRVTNALLTAGKEYVCLMHLHSDVSDAELEKILSKFRGKIKQLPPKKSAVKRRVRERSIYYLDVIERDGREVLFRVGCEAGTYIRKLVHDIGIAAGSGAHMAELRRTKAGPFNEDLAVTLQDVADAFHYYNAGEDTKLKNMLIPIEAGVSHLKKIYIYDEAVDSLCHGAFLKVPGVACFDSDIERGDKVAVMTTENRLVLVGNALLSSSELNDFKKGLAVETLQVFMKLQK